MVGTLFVNWILSSINIIILRVTILKKGKKIYSFILRLKHELKNYIYFTGIFWAYVAKYLIVPVKLNSFLWNFLGTCIFYTHYSEKILQWNSSSRLLNRTELNMGWRDPNFFNISMFFRVWFDQTCLIGFEWFYMMHLMHLYYFYEFGSIELNSKKKSKYWKNSIRFGIPGKF